MALTEIPVELSSTPGIADSSNATAITIDSSEKTTFSGAVQVGVDDTGHDVTLYGATSGRYVHWDESNDSLDFKDSVYARFGTGNDLNIYHDGSHSMINAASGTGALKLKSNDIRLENSSASNVLKAVGDGYVTMPLQPAFYSDMTTTAVDKTGGGSNYSITEATWTDRVDKNGDFSNGTFTAPVTGFYHFELALTLSGVASGHTNATISLISSNRTLTVYKSPGVDENTSLGGVTYLISSYFDMDASDTVYCQISIAGGSDVIDVFNTTRFSGSLIN